MNLDNYLKANGLKKMFFASQLGLSRHTLALYMGGKRRIPLHVYLAVRYITKDKVTEIKKENR